MIALALRKFAAENGMHVARGVAYGDLQGYAATLSEGMGYKDVVLSLRFPNDESLEALRKRVKKKSVRKRFQLHKFEIGSRRIHVRFHDHYGDTNNIRTFCKWFFPILKESGAQGTAVCPLCGSETDARSKWKMADRTAMLLHESCAEAYERKRQSKDLYSKEQQSYARGFVGALLGGLLGSVFMVFITHFSLIYMRAVMLLGGFILGFMAFNGYDLFRGRQGRGKLPIIALVLLLCVVLSNAANLFISFYLAFRQHGLAQSAGEILAFALEQIKTNPDLQRAQLADLLMGLLAVILGTAVPMYRGWKRTRAFRLKELQ